MAQNPQIDPRPSIAIDRFLDEKLRQAARDGRRVGRATIEATTPTTRSTIVVEDADRLGVLAGSVSVQRTNRVGGAVARKAESLVRRITYLQEPLAVIEAEDRRGRAIVRSASPRPASGAREYNEAVIDEGNSITIRRFRAESGSRRRQVGSNLSRETLGRLADDLAEIVSQD